MASRHHLAPHRSGGRMANPFQFLQHEVNRLFEDVLPSDFGMAGGDGSGHALMPRMEVRETDKDVRVIAELPGVTEKDIEVSLNDDVLTVRGEKKSEHKEDRENVHFTERTFGMFERSIRLPYHVEPNQVKANFANGVLTITMPRNKALEQSKKIPVQKSQA